MPGGPQGIDPARQVELGNLDHRVPVKRRDQLGDLARSFNHMTDSVQSMLADVAEKERLGRELELAREIQESLLPDRHLRHGEQHRADYAERIHQGKGPPFLGWLEQ